MIFVLYSTYRLQFFYTSIYSRRAILLYTSRSLDVVYKRERRWNGHWEGRKKIRSELNWKKKKRKISWKVKVECCTSRKREREKDLPSKKKKEMEKLVVSFVAGLLSDVFSLWRLTYMHYKHWQFDRPVLLLYMYIYISYVIYSCIIKKSRGSKATKGWQKERENSPPPRFSNAPLINAAAASFF